MNGCHELVKYAIQNLHIMILVWLMPMKNGHITDIQTTQATINTIKLRKKLDVFSEPRF